MFDALIHRKDRKVTGSGETTVAEGARQVAKDGDGPVAVSPDTIHKIRPGEMKSGFGHRFAGVAQQVLRFRSQMFFDFGEFHRANTPFFR